MSIARAGEHFVSGYSVMPAHIPQSKTIWMNSACDWGVSDPLAVPKTALEMKKRGHLATAIDQVIFKNPKKFLKQSGNFKGV